MLNNWSNSRWSNALSVLCSCAACLYRFMRVVHNPFIDQNPRTRQPCEPARKRPSQVGRLYYYYYIITKLWIVCDDGSNDFRYTRRVANAHKPQHTPLCVCSWAMFRKAYVRNRSTSVGTHMNFVCIDHLVWPHACAHDFVVFFVCG